MTLDDDTLLLYCGNPALDGPQLFFSARFHAVPLTSPLRGRDAKAAALVVADAAGAGRQLSRSEPSSVAEESSQKSSASINTVPGSNSANNLRGLQDALCRNTMTGVFNWLRMADFAAWPLRKSCWAAENRLSFFRETY